MDVGNRGDSVLSEANVTDVHESLNFDMLVGQTMDDREQRGMSFSFGIWSLQWSSDGKEIIAGTGDQCLCVFDVERMRVNLVITLDPPPPSPGGLRGVPRHEHIGRPAV